MELCSKLTPTFEGLVPEQTRFSCIFIFYDVSFVKLNSCACLFSVTIPLRDLFRPQDDSQKWVPTLSRTARQHANRSHQLILLSPIADLFCSEGENVDNS